MYLRGFIKEKQKYWWVGGSGYDMNLKLLLTVKPQKNSSMQSWIRISINEIEVAHTLFFFIRNYFIRKWASYLLKT